MEGEKQIKSESEAGWKLGSLRVSVGKRERCRGKTVSGTRGAN